MHSSCLSKQYLNAFRDFGLDATKAGSLSDPRDDDDDDGLGKRKERLNW